MYYAVGLCICVRGESRVEVKVSPRLYDIDWTQLSEAAPKQFTAVEESVSPWWKVDCYPNADIWHGCTTDLWSGCYPNVGITSSQDAPQVISPEDQYIWLKLKEDECFSGQSSNASTPGFVKDKVYLTPVTDIAELRGRIYAAMGLVTPEMLSRVRQEIEYRLDIVRATNDAHIEVRVDYRELAELQIATEESRQNREMLRSRIEKKKTYVKKSDKSGLSTTNAMKFSDTNKNSSDFGSDLTRLREGRAEMVRSEVKKKNDEFITENGEVDVSGTETAKEETTKDLVNKLKYELEECNRKLDKTIEVMKIGKEYGGGG
ncbi:hypothetical protein ANN_27373 [Periplaneta americana]|uniref:Uncharacterized protein n=1 Tax=Periplaneta americana TaxID=6978 RepID=A0ABQ8RY35_PERAM|nr:hypothetical protein ANN_27373 [Periplaneta americana]